MKHRWTRAIALTTLLTVTTSSIGCGYVLYPERRGNPGGTVDGGTLVMDLLWLLVGVVPGVVFLVVDFTSGAMYVNGGVAMRATPTGDVTVKLNDSKSARTLELRLVTASKRVLDRKLADVGPTIHDESVDLHGGTALIGTHEKVFLQIVDPSRPQTEMLVPVAVL
jgi:hypothetical protein